MKPVPRPIAYLYIALGGICLTLGSVGIFVPVLPTTPFLLLAAFFFFRSSERMHRRLVGHPRFGSYVSDYLSGAGIPLAAKKRSVATLWASIGLSVATVTTLAYLEDGPRLALRGGVGLAAGLCIVATLVTFYILTRPTSPAEVPASSPRSSDPSDSEAR